VSSFPFEDRNEPLTDLPDIRRQAILSSPFQEKLQATLHPADLFPIRLPPQKISEHALRVLQGSGFAGEELMCVGAWIEAEGFPSQGKTLSFSLILRLEAGQDPGFPLGMGQAEDDGQRLLPLRACLIEAGQPLEVAVAVPDQDNRIWFEISPPKEEEDSPCSECVRCSRAPVEMAMSLQSALPEQVARLAPLQIGRAVFESAPQPITVQRLRLDPLNFLTEDPICQTARGPAIRVRFAHNDEDVGALGNHPRSQTYVFCTTQDSPTVLQNSPGAITSFHRS
jgi:hypothetical protein